jgi:hypothetical protein
LFVRSSFLHDSRCKGQLREHGAVRVAVGEHHPEAALLIGLVKSPREDKKILVVRK